MSPPLRIGTRGSPLALVQANLVRRALADAHPALAAPDAIQVVPIRTTADRITDRPLAEVGGKGLFAKEIEAALLAGDIDVAVHSLKDMETSLPAGLSIGAVLPREDPRDVLIAARASRVADLPKGARLGTCSLRRQAQLLHARPDLEIVPLRGNVNTRLAKVADGTVDATVLARAGLARLGLSPEGAAPLASEEMLPAAGQGAIAAQCRDDDADVSALLTGITHRESEQRVFAERAALAALDGSCRTPIAAFAEIDGDRMRLRALVAAPDGTRLYHAERAGAVADGANLGRDAGEELRAAAPASLFAQGP